ncbi:MAG: hypothetical protein ABFD46_02820 [Armatimonadota bacterium]
MGDSRTLEEELEYRSKKSDDAKELWHRYGAMKAHLINQYYPWIQANCPWFTDHGEAHIDSVIRSASWLLLSRLPTKVKPKLTCLDLFLVLAAILWHDVGNVYSRTGHADISKITNEIKALGFPNVSIHRLVAEISKAHVGKAGLDIPKLNEICATSHDQHKVYTRALAAVLRFADEISENRSRISQALLPSVPDSNRIYWEYANCISACKPEVGREEIVVEVEIPLDKVATKFYCSDYPELTDKEEKISLIHYILCRLEKMNTERVYCAGLFGQYTSIRHIVARFCIMQDTTRVDGYDLELVLGDDGLQKDSYPEIPIVTKFFECNPNWQPETLEEALLK